MSVNRIFKSFYHSNIPEFQQKMLRWAKPKLQVQCLLHSNNYNDDKYSEYSSIFAAGENKSLCVINEDLEAFEKLKKFSDNINDWIFGFFSYDIKNITNKLYSRNFDGVNMPLMYFFRPSVLFIFSNNNIEIGVLESFDANSEDIFNSINNYIIQEQEQTTGSFTINPRVDKKEYLDTIAKIKHHIQQGDIYEMNYCFEFFSNNAEIDPLSTYEKINRTSLAPFSSYFKYFDKYLLCFSPERYLKKTGNKVISQPIKGTAGRGKTKTEDEKLAESLLNSQKERSENVMIVDLVRNDLSRTAKKDTVKVEELFGVYKFAQVFQMISTITSELNPDYHYLDIVEKSFPMGSMTGAPKIKAMELAEKYENTKRGLYSGSVGYFKPNKDFDFNVVIRSLLYCKMSAYLSFMVGSAITSGSSPEKEFEECLLKAKTMEIFFK